MNKLVLTFAFLIAFSLMHAQEFETILEEFTDNSRGWPIETGDDYRTSIENGVYKIENTGSTPQISGISWPIDPNYDFSIETKLVRPFELKDQSKSAFYGLIIGNTSEKNYMMFVLNGERKAVVNQIVSGKSERLVQPEVNSAITEAGENVFKVVKEADVIKYIINGTVLYQGKNYCDDGVEFFFCSFDKVSFHVDYLKVTRKSMKIKLVENSVNGYKLENLGENVNSEYSELAPVISSDGTILYVVRTHPDNIGGEKFQEIWYAESSAEGTWKPLTNFGKPFNNQGHNGVISITPDGNSILLKDQYGSDGSRSGNGVSISRKRDGKWQFPENQSIDNFVNEGNTVGYCLSPDGIRMIISMKNTKASKSLDLYICSLQDNGQWSEPQNMGNVVNSFATEFAPFLAPDQKTLYFASYGHPGYGSADIFVSRRLDDSWLNWSEPENLGPEVNSKDWEGYFNLSAKGDYAYMVSANPEITLGNSDIFRIKLSKAASIDPVVLVSGMVYNRKTNEIINAEITYEILSTGKEAGRAYSTAENGYKIALAKGAVYGYRAEAPGFISISENLDLSNLETFEEKKINLYLVPMEKGQTIRLNNIFFDYDKSEIRPESVPELNRLIATMQQNPDMKIEIGGHTDSSGSDEYNKKLSGERAAAVMNYLTLNGIGKDRVTSKSYGETKPVTSNEREEGRQQNRRVEFVIL